MPSGRENNISTYYLFAGLYLVSVIILGFMFQRFNIPVFFILPIGVTGFLHVMMVKQRDRNIRYTVTGKQLVLEGNAGARLVLKNEQIIGFSYDKSPDMKSTGPEYIDKKTFMPFSAFRYGYLIYKNGGRRKAVKILPDDGVREYLENLISARAQIKK